jgi:dTMP kinase
VSRGFFITLEGGEGAGKSTQIKRLAASLTAEGHDVVVTREPGGSPGAEQIRSLLLDASLDFDGTAQALLFAAARRDHVQATIAPALERGAIVLCDRFMDSTRAYQGAAGDVPGDVIGILENIAVGRLRPDLTLILDAPVELGLKRASLRHGASLETADRFERETLGFHRAVREAFQAIARQEPERCVVVDASAGADAVFVTIRKEVERRLALAGGR